MLRSIIVASAYFYFHYRYFALVSAALQRPHMPGVQLAGTFLLNYASFVVSSILEWNLLLNWSLFFLLLLGETIFYCKSGWRTALFCSLSGILHGLIVNIFCRCVVSIVTAQPLRMFDNNVSSDENLKVIPVFLGFVLGGAVLHWMASPNIMKELRILIEHPAHLPFQLELMGGIFAYLFLNLLLYQTSGNDILRKLWGIKSCLFGLSGFYLGLRYALKMCHLSDYRAKNRAIQREVIQKEQAEARLRTIAYRDMLTGVYNRQYGLKQLEELLLQRTPFALCYLDLDDLKGINDRYGHIEGDRYLTAAAQELARACREDRDLLARYGGDEFLLLLSGAGAPVAEERLHQVNRRLRELHGSGAYPYPMSLSFGVVESRNGEDMQTLLSLADEAMYRMKRERAVEKQGE